MGALGMQLGLYTTDCKHEEEPYYLCLACQPES